MTSRFQGRLMSVNVGLPRDIPWRGRIIHTGIFKEPVMGRRRVTRLNIEGDGQGDREGHGGEQRAVFVYQTDSYNYWADTLNRRDLVPGHFGENFTVSGLSDEEVCIGDRYQIGNALFEVSQPRVTCYRIGIRMDHPEMAALLTGSGRPGFYFRVLEEGEVEAGDEIELVAKGPQCMSVTEINALLYSSHHPKVELERALQIEALSPGWRWSFDALLKAQDAKQGGHGNAGLAPEAAASAAAPGFQAMQIARITQECEDVLSFELVPADGKKLTLPTPGQHVILQLRPASEGKPLFRSYSLSGHPSDSAYRISVKIEPHGAAGGYLSTDVRPGDRIDVSHPRGRFILQPGEEPIVLLSAGIGATPVLAMLHDLANNRSSRPVWWLHVARNRAFHAFGPEVRQLLSNLVHGRSWIWFSRPSAKDRLGTDFDARGRPSVDAFSTLGVPREADFYLCGPRGFIDDLTTSLASWGVASNCIHSELFASGPALTPGIVETTVRAPHQPEGPIGNGPTVSFVRSGLTVRWREDDQNLLDLAEACDVPVRWSCRTGVCHNCESGLISGSVTNRPEPLDPPADGNVLICCAKPNENVVIDL